MAGGFSRVTNGIYTPQIVTSSGKAIGSAYVAGAGQRIPGTQNVLGADTGPSSNQTKQVGGYYNGVLYNPNNVQMGASTNNNNNNSGDNSGPSASDINDAYAPALEGLNADTNDANRFFSEDTSNLAAKIKTQSGQLDTQQGELMDTSATEQKSFLDTLTSALQDAIRSYNALAQQGNAKFGRGNSAGQAVSELINQEFLRNQGANQKQEAEGNLNFENERKKIVSFISGKKDELKNYEREANTFIQKTLADTLGQIRNRRGDIETNKTRDRLTALQNAESTAKSVRDANKKFQQDAALTAVGNLQTSMGKAFTPEEFKVNYQDFMNVFSNLEGSQVQDMSPASNAIRNISYNSKDPYADTQIENLNSPSGINS